MDGLFNKVVNRLFRGRKLIGPGEIEDYLLLRHGGMTLHDWRIFYPDFPVTKENGQLVAFTGELAAWQAEHPDITEDLDDISQPRVIVQTRIVKTRYGLERIERRRIIF